jgi:hypothetical protein
MPKKTDCRFKTHIDYRQIEELTPKLRAKILREMADRQLRLVPSGTRGSWLLEIEPSIWVRAAK